MKPSLASLIIAILFAQSVSMLAIDKAYVSKPNVLILYADDLGYGDVQCYNPQRGLIPTPNIDRLASEGMRFTDAHSASGVCTPSRYSLLTGRYPWRTRLQNGVVTPFQPPLIPPGRMTIASLAKLQGYRTACIGKWHLGLGWAIEDLPGKLPLLVQKPIPADDEGTPLPSAESVELWREIFSKPIANGPTTLGFDRFFGTDAPNYPPYCFIENDRTAGIPSVYLPHEKLVKNQASWQGPAMKDWRLEDILPSLGDQAVSFIDEAAKAKEPFLMYLALTSPHTPLAVNEPWRGKSGLNEYADFVMETDAFVGRILDALEASGEARHTLVILTSDNGCTPGIGVDALEKKGHFPSADLRGYKASAWEGGHRVPFIVRWPGVIEPGQICPQLVGQSDLLATLADVFDTTLPENAGEDSISFLPLLKGFNQPVRELAVSCSLHGVPALRQGPWKLIFGNASHFLDAPSQPQPIQLYNLEQDPAETTNLAEKNPQRVAKMKSLMEKIIADGRSTPGPPQENDVAVIRHPTATAKLPATTRLD
jgi:arylsulfatase A